jgi:uncharacterized Ntn-hydrolase superfamily protein
MTFSIVARCDSTGELGVAAVTAVPAVGKLLTWARPGAGAVATQAWINPYLGMDGLELLRAGRAAGEALEEVLARDPDPHLRQLAMVDAAGRVAVHTGEGCTPWAGHITGNGFAVQGNCLVDGHTLDAMVQAFEDGRGRELAERLLLALEAGARLGGDKRGCTSATVYVVHEEDYPLWDMRVDDHTHPLAELRRLYGVFCEQVVPQVRRLPKRGDPHGEPDLKGGTGLA